MATALNCTFCHENYDLDSRLPHVAPCGHSLCHTCLLQHSAQKFMQCVSCDSGFAVAIFPINHGLKDQLEQFPTNEDKEIDIDIPLRPPSPGWHCAECSLPLHPRQARVCIRCTPKEIAENTVQGVVIHDCQQLESQLVCAHCVMESRHRFHITKLYLPAKMKKFASTRYASLLERSSQSCTNKEESDIVKQALSVLRDRSISSVSWSSFEQNWREAEEVTMGIENMNRGISEGLRRVEEALKEIEECQTHKQTLLDRLTSSIARNCVSPSAKRRSRSVVTTRRLKKSTSSSTDSDTDSVASTSSLLRRFGAIPDLRQVGTDEE